MTRIMGRHQPSSSRILWLQDCCSPRVPWWLCMVVCAISFLMGRNHVPASSSPTITNDINAVVTMMATTTTKSGATNDPSTIAAVYEDNTCMVDKLDFPFRTIEISQPINYKMFLYGAGKDIYISDAAFNSNGTKTFEMHIQQLMYQQLKGRTPNETTILDIGANIGTHALHLASNGFIVHAFEPSTENFNLLKCSKVVNHLDNLVLNKFGLSKEDATLCLNTDKNNRGHAVLGNRDCLEANKVLVKKLDDYIDVVLKGESPYMIKIDVEGHEMIAFEGGTKMFERDPPKLIFAEIQHLRHEAEKKKFVDFFWSYNYTIYLVSGMKKVERGTANLYGYDVIMVHS